MLSPEDLTEVLDYVENFDEKEIQFVIMGTVGRCGSTLFHSLLDNHSQVLQIPIYFCYFLDWEYVLTHSSRETIVPDFLTKSFALAPKVGNLGENQDITLDLRLLEIAQIMKEVIPYISNLDRKKFLFLFHVIYAKLFSITLSQVKAILLHHHVIPNIYGYFAYIISRERYINEEDWNSILALTPLAYSHSNDFLLAGILEDFPNARFLITIRHPFANLHANEKFFFSLRGKEHDLSIYYLCSFSLLVQYYSLYGRRLKLGSQLKLIKFEDLHLQAEQTMRETADFMSIEFNNSLLETTFGGILWTGTGSTHDNKIIIGTNPEIARNDIKWKTDWDHNSLTLFSTLGNSIAKAFGYEPSECGVKDDNINSLLLLEAEVFYKYPEHVTTLFTKAIARYASEEMKDIISQELMEGDFLPRLKLLNNQLCFWVKYPTMRNKVIQYLYRCAEELAVCQVGDDYASAR